MAYWSDKVAGALEESLSRLKDFAHRRDLDATSLRRALRECGRLSATEVRARVAEIPNPGALPSPEHDRSGDWFLPFAARFRNHREAREWAHDRVHGVTTVAVDGSELRP